MFNKVKQYLILLFESLKSKFSRWFKLKLFSISGKTLKQYFSIQRNTKWRLLVNIYVLITLIYCPYLDNIYQNWVESESYHMYYIILMCSFINLYLIRFFFVLPGFSFIFDLKTIFLKLKEPFIYLNLTVVNLKKYFLFLFGEKFIKPIKLLNIFIDFVLSKFLLWRPLFKRFSYFGNFRLTNSKFFKN